MAIRSTMTALLLGLAVAPGIALGQMGGQLGGCPACGASTGMGGAPGQGGPGFSNPVDHYANAKRDIHRGQYSDAIPQLEAALNTRPHSADIMNDLGYVYRMLGNYPLSLKWIRLALAQDPDHRKSHEDLGELYLATQDTASAQAQLAELVRLCPDSCDERDLLTKAIADNQASHPPAASTMPPQTPSGSH